MKNAWQEKYAKCRTNGTTYKSQPCHTANNNNNYCHMLLDKNNNNNNNWQQYEQQS